MLSNKEKKDILKDVTFLTVITQKHKELFLENIGLMLSQGILPFEYIVVNTNLNASVTKLRGNRFKKFQEKCIIRELSLYAALEIEKIDNGSKEHAAALNLGLSQLRTKYVLIIDPDFFLFGETIFEVVRKVKSGDVYVGLPWSPRWYTKDRNSLTPHFLMLNWERVEAGEFKVGKLRKQKSRIEKSNRFRDLKILKKMLLRFQIGKIRDTHFIGVDRPSKVSARATNQAFHVVRLGIDVKKPKSSNFGFFLEKFLPSQISYLPRKNSSLQIKDHSLLNKLLDEGELIGFGDKILGLHLRMHGRGNNFDVREMGTIRDSLDIIPFLRIPSNNWEKTPALIFFVRNLANLQTQKDLIAQLSADFQGDILLGTFEKKCIIDLTVFASEISRNSNYLVRAQLFSAPNWGLLERLIEHLLISQLWNSKEIETFDFYKQRNMNEILVPIRKLPSWLIRIIIKILTPISKFVGLYKAREFLESNKLSIEPTYITNDIHWHFSAQKRVGILLNLIGGKGIYVVNSWDNLITKSSIANFPWTIMTWNEDQATQAQMIHKIPRERVDIGAIYRFELDRNEVDLDSQFHNLAHSCGVKYFVYLASSPRVSTSLQEIVLLKTYLEYLQIYSTNKNCVIVKLHPSNKELRNLLEKTFQHFIQKKKLVFWEELTTKKVSCNCSVTFLGACTTAVLRVGKKGSYLPPFAINSTRELSTEIPHFKMLFGYLESKNGITFRLNRTYLRNKNIAGSKQQFFMSLNQVVATKKPAKEMNYGIFALSKLLSKIDQLVYGLWGKRGS